MKIPCRGKAYIDVENLGGVSVLLRTHPETKEDNCAVLLNYEQACKLIKELTKIKDKI